MKENFTSINVIIDESGSMNSLSSDTIGGFNKFLTDQKTAPGTAVFSLCTFNTTHRMVHDCAELTCVAELTNKDYRPGGGTALLDAVGTTINSVGQKLATMPEEDRPSKVVFLIITDGQENASKEFHKAQIAEMISHQKEKYSWEFVFMGANIDTVAEAKSMGIAAANSLSYSPTKGGTKDLYSNVSDSLKRYRSSGPSTNGFFGNGNKS